MKKIGMLLDNEKVKSDFEKMVFLTKEMKLSLDDLEAMMQGYCCTIIKPDDTFDQLEMRAKKFISLIKSKELWH